LGQKTATLIHRPSTGRQRLGSASRQKENRECTQRAKVNHERTRIDKNKQKFDPPNMAVMLLLNHG
jgi:hypothetical protein